MIKLIINKDSLIKYYCFLLTTFLCVSSRVCGQNTHKPNIVFLLADDLGWADLPSYGNRFNESPNIDQLAESGMRFTDAYSAAPVCSPGRAGIITGRYPARIGINDFIIGHWRPYEEVLVPKNRTQYLPKDQKTIAELLKTTGYATGYFGKWHLGDGKEHHPLVRGFDNAHVGQGYYQVNYNPKAEVSKNDISADQLAEMGIRFIENNKQQPFFLYLSYFDVHVPYDAKQELISKYLKKEKVLGYPCNALYAASIEQMDQSIGKIIKKLKKEKLLDNTVIVFVSDNGGSISESKYPEVTGPKFPVIYKNKRNVYHSENPLQYIGTSNLPLRNEKGSVYEGGIRVPLIINWPKKIEKGICSEPVIGVDFFPTFSELTNTPIPVNYSIDGLSILPLLFQKEFRREYIYWHYPVYHHDVPAAAIRNRNWKLVNNLVDGSYALYNLNADIGETTDLKEVYPQKAQKLLIELTKWQKDVNAEFPFINDEFDRSRRMIWGIHPDRK